MNESMLLDAEFETAEMIQEKLAVLESTLFKRFGSSGNQIINSLVIVEILDFLHPRQVVKMQAVSRRFYDKIIPLYCENRPARISMLQTMQLP